MPLRYNTLLTGSSLLSTLLLADAGCIPEPNEPVMFPAHCWESLLNNADMPEHATVLNNFPTTCTDDATGLAFLADHPAAGFFNAKGCPISWDPSANSIRHYLTKSFIPKHMAGQTYTSDEETGYVTTSYAVASGAETSCIAYLTCNGTNTGCDVDSSQTGNQNCKKSDANILCEIWAEDPLFDLLWNGGGTPLITQYPICSLPEYSEIKPEYASDWTPELNATDDGTAGCFDDDGIIPAGSDGADSTGAPAAPFGHVSMLISCTGTVCSLDPALILNIMENFSVFYDEGILLSLVDSSTTCGPGLKVSGLSAGDDAKELADEFGIMNNDVIWKLNGTILSTTGRLETALHDLATATNHEVVVKTRNGSSCDLTTYDLTVE